MYKHQSTCEEKAIAVCNFEKSNMSGIEAGKTNFTISTLYKISKALDIKLSELVDGVD
jgi:hypothetical protein